MLTSVNYNCTTSFHRMKSGMIHKWSNIISQIIKSCSARNMNTSLREAQHNRHFTSGLMLAIVHSWIYNKICDMVCAKYSFDLRLIKLHAKYLNNSFCFLHWYFNTYLNLQVSLFYFATASAGNTFLKIPHLFSAWTFCCYDSLYRTYRTSSSR